MEKNTSMSKAITLMDSKEIKELPVVHNKKYFGLLVYYDLISNEALKSDKIEKFVRKVAVLSPKDSIDKAIRSMQMNGMGAIPITDEDDKLVGIVSDYDIIKLLINSRVFDSLKVEDVVIRRFPILRTEDTLGKAQKLAALNRVDGLPIIDNFGKVVGQVLLSDILRYTFAVVAGKKSDKKGMDANKDTALEKNVMEISRRELPQISLTLNLRKALEMMLSAKIKGSIVVDNDGKPVGILSRLKILDMLGGKSIGDNIDVQLSGEYDWDFILLIRSEINKRERLFYNEAGIQRMKIHVKKIRDITGKYQLNLLASGKKNFNVKVEGVVKDLLLQEALEKLENMLEHNRRDF
ncbi:MAG: CBS domain-containing protein [Candidatus Parvarchaeota archaeon]|nr:CBS domain-containing protein [Candidatus Parvarchaeota archaeon]